MQDTVSGINEETLSDLSLLILDYVDDLSEIFDNIDEQMNQLSLFYNGKPESNINEYYEGIKNNYKTVKNNIKSYSDDLITLISKVNENDKYLGRLFQSKIEETTSMAKSIKNEEAIEWL